MTVKETIILALKLARREQRDLVVGLAEERWQILPLEDPLSDQLAESFIITPQGFRYPDDEYRLSDVIARGL